MNIMFLTTSLPNLSKSSFYGDLINEFRLHNHNMFVVVPNVEQSTTYTIENNVHVLRVKSSAYHDVSNIRKGLAYQQMIISFFKSVKYYIGYSQNIDCLISTSLPLEISVLIKYLKKKYHAKYYLIHRDFTWQDAVGFGFFHRYGPITLYYRVLEKIMYKQADYIGCMSDGCVKYIKDNNKYLDGNKLHVLHNYMTPMSIFIDNKKEIENRYGLKNKFVVIYGGNASIAQNLNRVLDLAEQFVKYEDILFLILGKGNVFENLKQLAESRQLNNIRFENFIPKEQYLQLLALCDVGLICLNERLQTPNIPSKAMSYYNVSIPILAAVDPVTDFGTMLEENKCGVWALSNDMEGLKQQLLKLYNNRELCKQMGKNGYDFYINNMLPKHAYSTIYKYIQ